MPAALDRRVVLPPGVETILDMEAAQVVELEAARTDNRPHRRQ